MNNPSPHVAFAQAAETIGRVTIAWNEAHFVLAALFNSLSGADMRQSEAIYYAIKNESAQRDIIRAVANVTLENHPAILSRLTTALSRIGELSGRRNAAIHTVWAFSIPRNKMLPVPTIPHHRKLDEAQTVAQFSGLLADISEVVSDLIEVRKDALHALHDTN